MIAVNTSTSQCSSRWRPFVALAGLPVIGYAFVAVAWMLTRAIAEYLDHRAEAAGGELRTRLGRCTLLA